MDISSIAGYRVIRSLGAGGMGQVFLVQHPRLPRRDALKLLEVGVSRDGDFKARFQREADLLALLSHPNIVTLHDRGEFEGRLWITMEYVAGTDAAQLLQAHGPAPLELVLTLIGGAGAALDYAWRKQRITHRDVKPANILLAIDGTEVEAVKLADFGIAKAAGEATSLTSTGITVGTLSYISPEAIEGGPVDNRSDIYSLGCTAYHLLTGRAPFAGETTAALMSAHLTREAPPITESMPGLPSSLNGVFAKVLAKNPNHRYQSCDEFVAALSAARVGAAPQIDATPPFGAAPHTAARTMPVHGSGARGEAGRRRPMVIAASVLVLAAAAGAGFLLMRPDRPSEPVSAATDASDVRSVPAAAPSAPSAPPVTVASPAAATTTDHVAGASGLVMSQSPRTSGPSRFLQYPASSGRAWWPSGSRVALVCYVRGQAVTGHYGNDFPGGVDSLWYRTPSGDYIADVDMNTGTNDPVTRPC